MAGKAGYALTPEIQQNICAYIKAGGYPHVAAQAAGIPKDVFEQWLSWGSPGKGKRPQKAYVEFKRAIEQAIAIARLNAEIKAYQDDPVVWLRNGPGKERPHDPGWSVGVKPTTNTTNQQINILLNPELQGLFAALLQILSPYPDARTAVAQALAGDTLLPHRSP